MSGRKIPLGLDDPIDQAIIRSVEWAGPWFRSMGMTPNDLTTCSLISGVGAAAAIFTKQHPLWFAGLYLTSYWFDVADGNYARRYKMTSPFGDWYDHIKDWVVISMVVSAFVANYRGDTWQILELAMILGLAWIGTSVHVGCQDKWYALENPTRAAQDSTSIEGFRCLCPGNTRPQIEESMEWSRFLGTGVSTHALVLYLTYRMWGMWGSRS